MSKEEKKRKMPEVEYPDGTKKTDEASADSPEKNEGKKRKMPEVEYPDGASSSDETAEAKDGEGEEKAAEDDKVILTKAEADKIAAALQDERDKYMRMMAEYENYRKRTASEREGLYADAYAEVLKEILPVFDNLALAANYEDGVKVAEGVRMTLKQFTEALGKLGIEEFGAPGDKFDPTIHNAVMHIEDENYDEETVVDVFTKGYRRGDKILRFAMVRVAN